MLLHPEPTGDSMTILTVRVISIEASEQARRTFHLNHQKATVSRNRHEFKAILTERVISIKTSEQWKMTMTEE